ncbi:hypothetical protein [Nonomuraea sediminis]|uniref:hypothetical protein n=1 Tax=Nonomuraea sediminis TaxID=2835864 RepID=UPI001BDD38FB|nr:hypothetical protein [Nonomuraea sediminis]
MSEETTGQSTLEERLARVEQVLGLQRLQADDGGDGEDAAGCSAQSNNCSHHSSASILCGAIDEVPAVPLRF